MTQPELFPTFDGASFSAELDGERLATQLARVYAALARGGWWTLAALAAEARGSEAGVSARLRDLRKERCGGHVIERRRVAGANGLWEYRLRAV